MDIYTIEGKYSKAQLKWIVSLARHNDWCYGPGRSIRQKFLKEGLIETRLDQAVRITDKGLQLVRKV